ncbi:PAS domain-containing protein [Acetobacteraceae bacterium H6797]|nr:PAS domain-containing protein [Acetobacteraceae bacterium H6797]
MALLLLLTFGGFALAFLPQDERDDRRYLRLSEIARQAATVGGTLQDIEREARRAAQAGGSGVIRIARSQLIALRREVSVLRDVAADVASTPKLRAMARMLPDDGSLRWSEGMASGELAEAAGLARLVGAVEREAEAALHGFMAEEREERLLKACLPGAAGLVLVGLLWAMKSRRARFAQAARTAERKAIQESARVGTALIGPDLRVIESDEMLTRMACRPRDGLRGKTLEEAMPCFAEGLAPLLRRALAGEEGLGSRALSACGANGNRLYWTVSMQPVRRPGGKVEAVCLAAVDMTARMEAEAAHLRTAHELNHRVKNTLATVQSLAAQTLRISGDDPQRFRQQFAARLQGVARSHDLLTAAGWGAVLLGAAVRVGLAGPLGAGTALIEQDEEVWLRPAQVQAVLIALQELADNAQRHGALSRPGGRIHLGWSRGPDGMARFSWRESHAGGRRIPLQPPQRSQEGFGLRLLRRALPQDLGSESTVSLDFAAEGLHCAFLFRPAEPGESFAAPTEAPSLS